MSEVPFSAFRAGMDEKECSVDMNRVAGSCDILFICLDTLRYDAATAEEKRRHTCIKQVRRLGEAAGTGEFHLSFSSCDFCRVSSGKGGSQEHRGTGDTVLPQKHRHGKEGSQRRVWI